VIGLIGAIGAGKSAAAKLLAGLGGDVVDCDALGHTAINRPEVLAELVRRWGPTVANADGSANRRAVAGIVFRQPEELKFLEGKLFPIIGGMAFERIQACKAPFLVLDAAMLIEADWRQMCDRAIFIDAPRDMRVQRVANRGWSDTDLAEREASQLPNDEKKAQADAVLRNDGSLDEMRTKIETLLKQWNIG
jgi:dephospho-CoA kinase